jgi:Protein of unknown function (DUF3761)
MMTGLPPFAPHVRDGIAVAVLLMGLVGPAVGRDLLPNGQPDDELLDRHGHYTNSTGQSVHQPAKSLNGKVPLGASAQCRDGDYSFSQHSSGTCSGHGGVAAWLR